MNTDERQEMITVIGDFIEMGHVENIVAMFKKDPGLYDLAGDLLRDERYMVRMGMVLLFEELVRLRPDEVSLAVPALLPLLSDETPYIRGEAVTILGIIGTPTALRAAAWLTSDPDPQVAEVARDIVEDSDYQAG